MVAQFFDSPPLSSGVTLDSPANNELGDFVLTAALSIAQDTDNRGNGKGNQGQGQGNQGQAQNDTDSILNLSQGMGPRGTYAMSGPKVTGTRGSIPLSRRYR